MLFIAPFASFPKLRRLLGRFYTHRLRRCAANTKLFANAVLYFHRHGAVLFEKITGVVLALADAFLVVAVPGARFFDDISVDAQFEDLAFARDALAVENVEDRFAERRRNFVLHHFYARLRADHFVVLFDRADTANIQP